MPRVLILSSYVAASRVGGGAQALALARLGIDPVLVPTVLFGRHPGRGPPGGGPVDPAMFEAMIGGVEAQGLFGQFGAVITGYFSSAEQVVIAAAAAARVKAANPLARLVVDPIMGDAEEGLYVREAVAEAIADVLVPLADLVAPNAWELGRLTDGAVTDAASALAAAAALGQPALVSSVRDGGEIGAVLAARDAVWLASHPESSSAPKGVGDLLTAMFVAAMVSGWNGANALQFAVGVVADAVAMAKGADELPLAALPAELANAARLTVRRLDA